MAKAARTVRVDRPAREVFDFLADGNNNRLWQPTARPGAAPAAPVGVGTVFHQSMRHPLGFRIPTDYRINVWAPATELGFEGVGGGPFHPTGTYTLNQVNATATDVTFAIAVGRSPLALVLAPLLTLLFRREVGWITRAKAVLEATPSLASPA